MISTVIVTLNEAKKLQKCLESVKEIAGEIVILDLGSEDDVAKVVKKYNGILYKYRRVTYVELVRNLAIEKARGDWILVLDPDEKITSHLAEKLRQIAKEESFDAVNIPRKNVFFGKWIAHTNFWPDRQIRFFKKGKVIWTDQIHSYPKVFGKILDLPAEENLAIAHFGYDNIAQFWNRQKRYSSVEAENRYKNGQRFSFKNLLWLPLREFLVRFIKHKGFLDGLEGLIIVFILMFYKVVTELKLLKAEK